MMLCSCIVLISSEDNLDGGGPLVSRVILIFPRFMVDKKSWMFLIDFCFIFRDDGVWKCMISAFRILHIFRSFSNVSNASGVG